jgi:hypothetical protein
MIDRKEALRLIEASLASLARSGVLDKQISASTDTVLLGSGSDLDSLGFVTFITDLEDRIQQRTQQEHYLVLNEIAQFNIDRPELTVGVLVRYIVSLAGGPAGNG